MRRVVLERKFCFDLSMMSACHTSARLIESLDMIRAIILHASRDQVATSEQVAT